MTPPTFFAVEYAINPWMDIATPVDVRVAHEPVGERCARPTYGWGTAWSWSSPCAGLPGHGLRRQRRIHRQRHRDRRQVRFAERAGESQAYAEWMSSLGYRPVSTRHVNEGQGDLLMVGEMVLAGYGFRTDRRAHAEIAAALRLPVVSLELVDPRFYHLDTALAVLDDHTIAYYPPAFSARRTDQLHALFPDAIVVASADAYVLGLNVVSDGLHVVLPSAATVSPAQLRRAGFEPVGVDLSELLKGGGSVKCCTLEVFR